MKCTTYDYENTYSTVYYNGAVLLPTKVPRGRLDLPAIVAQHENASELRSSCRKASPLPAASALKGNDAEIPNLQQRKSEQGLTQWGWSASVEEATEATCASGEVTLRDFQPAGVAETCCPRSKVACAGCASFTGGSSCQRCAEGFIMREGKCTACTNSGGWLLGENIGGLGMLRPGFRIGISLLWMFAFFVPEKEDRSAALMHSLTMNEYEFPHRNCFIVAAGVDDISWTSSIIAHILGSARAGRSSATSVFSKLFATIKRSQRLSVDGKSCMQLAASDCSDEKVRGQSSNEACCQCGGGIVTQLAGR
ncbi:unnamed protein product [Symbiodinium necroappetens]|uniref:Uncharacterized protein n=1 Tax=Symbiodinium necroappetens TaxID=1628268 RepID=A0A812WXJ0_9DINO|nr:unnamed protein product [Symbiodinium necroappetens]